MNAKASAVQQVMWDQVRVHLKRVRGIDDTQLTWNAPGGLRGVVNNPGHRQSWSRVAVLYRLLT